MAVADVIDRISAYGNAAARLAVDRAGDGVAAIAASEIAGVGAVNDHGMVTLTAPGLRARAFGTRRRAADPRIAGLLVTLARSANT